MDARHKKGRLLADYYSQHMLPNGKGAPGQDVRFVFGPQWFREVETCLGQNTEISLSKTVNEARRGRGENFEKIKY
jgi:hypothetical protein